MGRDRLARVSVDDEMRSNLGESAEAVFVTRSSLHDGCEPCSMEGWSSKA